MTDATNGFLMRGEAVIVGIDGSRGGNLALDWAVANEDRLGPVVPVVAFHIESLVDGVGTTTMWDDMLDTLRRDAEARLDEAVVRHPHLAGRGRVVQGYPGPALVRAAEGQRLLVVGSRGRNAFVETLLGSVASHCVKHAPIPVAVIPPGTPADTTLDHLVVGVDGSHNADAAMAWAAGHVAPGGRITAVACRIPAPYALELVPPPPLPFSQLHDLATQAVERGTVGLDPDKGATVEVDVVDGDPRVVLRDTVADAGAVLVVGARGHRGASYLLLGSVTTSLAHHPTVPTVVVPGP